MIYIGIVIFAVVLVYPMYAHFKNIAPLDVFGTSIVRPKLLYSFPLKTVFSPSIRIWRCFFSFFEFVIWPLSLCLKGSWWPRFSGGEVECMRVVWFITQNSGITLKSCNHLSKGSWRLRFLSRVVWKEGFGLGWIYFGLAEYATFLGGGACGFPHVHMQVWGLCPAIA